MSVISIELPQPPMGLKEWSTVVGAAQTGDLRILVRKGGIHEPGFALKATVGLLFPTGFHQAHSPREPSETVTGAASREAGVTIEAGVRVAEIWRVVDPHAIESLAPWTGLPSAELRLRAQLRPTQAMWLMRVIPFELEKAVHLPWSRHYGGCRSWVQLPEDPRWRIRCVHQSPDERLEETLAGLVRAGVIQVSELSHEHGAHRS